MTTRLPLLAALLVPCVAACGGGADVRTEEAPLVLPAFADGVTHSHFPMADGRVLVYEGVHEGRVLREEVRALATPRTIEGVACTAVEEQTWLDGVLSSITTEWFAQDVGGSVWKFGEESLEGDGTTFTLSADSWIAGVDGGRAWRSFPAAPRVGERFTGYSRTGPVVHEVVSVAGAADVPAGAFQGCVEIVENPQDPEDRDVILYAPAVGRVLETNSKGHTALASIR